MCMCINISIHYEHIIYSISYLSALGTYIHIYICTYIYYAYIYIMDFSLKNESD